MNNEQQSELVQVCGLWQQTSKSGGKYLSGTLGNAKLLVFPNAYKEDGSNQPDHRVCIAPRPRRDDAPAMDTPATPDPPVAHDDLPF